MNLFQKLTIHEDNTGPEEVLMSRLTLNENTLSGRYLEEDELELNDLNDVSMIDAPYEDPNTSSLQLQQCRDDIHDVQMQDVPIEDTFTQDYSRQPLLQMKQNKEVPPQETQKHVSSQGSAPDIPNLIDLDDYDDDEANTSAIENVSTFLLHPSKAGARLAAMSLKKKEEPLGHVSDDGETKQVEPHSMESSGLRFRNLKNEEPMSESNVLQYNPVHQYGLQRYSQNGVSNFARPQPIIVNNNYFFNPPQQPSQQQRYFIDEDYEDELALLRLEKRKMKLGILPPPWRQESIPIWKTPYLISSYLQIMLNTFATLYVLRIIYSIIQVIRKDIDYQIDIQVSDALFQIEICRRDYFENNCRPGKVLPALRDQCSEWKSCMNRDPYTYVSYSSLGANILGSLFNSLLEPIGYKSFLFLIAFLVACYFVNFSCGFVRAKTYYGFDKKKTAGDGDDASEDSRERQLLALNYME